MTDHEKVMIEAILASVGLEPLRVQASAKSTKKRS